LSSFTANSDKKRRGATNPKFDPLLNKLVEEYSNTPETEIFVIVEFHEKFANLKRMRRQDRFGKEWEADMFELPGEIRSIIARYSTRIVHENIEVIPAMCVQAKIKNLNGIASQEFVSRIEMSTKANISLDDAEAIIHSTTYDIPNSSGGKDVLVSIIDTGITEITPLKGKIDDSQDWTWEGYSDTYIHHDHHGHYEHGHGTVIASIISYIAPNVHFLNYKAIHPFVGKTPTSPDKANVEVAVKEAMKKGADIINISLGFDPSQCPNNNRNCTLCKVVNRAVNYGINAIAAVGNDARSPPDCPAQAKRAISVGASKKADIMWAKSNKGPTNYDLLNPGTCTKPDIVAPGSGIYVQCSEDGSREYRTGTSFSAAIVSSIVGRCCEINNDPHLIRQALEKTAVKLIDPATRQDYPKADQGNGRINAKDMYQYIVNLPTKSKVSP
jgi:serine protease AprX